MEKLEEYKKYKLAAEDLKSNVTDFSQLFYRKKEEIIIDDNLLTCSGPGNALELAFKLLEKLTSKENLMIVKENMFLK